MVFNSDSRFDKDWKKLWMDMKMSNGNLELPDSFDFVPTLRCNLNCAGCYQKNCRHSYEMNEIEWSTMFENLNLENKIFKLIGGEIFVNGDVPAMLDNLTSMGVNIIIGTNAYNIPPTEKFLDWRIVEITTSIDGLAVTHDNMRGVHGAFKKVRDFIWDMGKHGYGYKILTTSMIYDNNLDELDDIKRLKDAFGIERMRFQIPKWSDKKEMKKTKKILGNIPIHQSSLSHNLDIDSINDIFDLTYGDGYYIQPSVFNKYPYDVIDKTVRANHKCMCKYLFRGKINPNGDVTPCFYINEPMGNLYEQSLEEIWNNDKYREFRMNLANNNLAPICENCCSMEII